MSSPASTPEASNASGHLASTSSTTVTGTRKDDVIAKNKERSDRVKIMKEQEEHEKQRRLTELKAAEERDASRRTAAAELRKQKLEDLKMKELERKKGVEERRRQMAQQEKEKNDAILNRFKDLTEERGARNRDKPVYAFGSSTPRTLTYMDSRRDGAQKLILGVHVAGAEKGAGQQTTAGGRAASMTSLARRNISASPSPEVHSPNHRGAKGTSVGPGNRAGRRPVRDSMTTSVFGSLGSGASASRPPRPVRDKTGLPPGLANASMTASYSTAEHVRNVRQPKPPVPRVARRTAQPKPLKDKAENSSSASPAARKPPPVPRPHRPAPGTATTERPNAPAARTKKPPVPSSNAAKSTTSTARKTSTGRPKLPSTGGGGGDSSKPGNPIQSATSGSSVANSVDMGIDGDGGTTPDSSLVPSPTPSPTSPSLPETADNVDKDGSRGPAAASGTPSSALVVTTALTNESPVSSNESVSSPRAFNQSQPMSDDSLVTVVDAIVKGDRNSMPAADHNLDQNNAQPTVVIEQQDMVCIPGMVESGDYNQDGEGGFNPEAGDGKAGLDSTPVQPAGNTLDGGTSEDFRTYTPTPTGKTGPVMTEEEAKASLAENRRLAREKLEREKEAERLRLEKEQAEEDARLQAEEDAFRAAVEEERRMAEQLKALEEERLQAAIQQAEQERLAREKEDQEARKQKEEEEKRNKEEAERLEKEKIEREERLQREETERSERKKKLDAIMARTRKTPNTAESGGTNPSGGVEPGLTSVSASSSGHSGLSNGFSTSGGDAAPGDTSAPPTGIVDSADPGYTGDEDQKMADGDYRPSGSATIGSEPTRSQSPNEGNQVDDTPDHQQQWMSHSNSTGDSTGYGIAPNSNGINLGFSLNENGSSNGVASVSTAAPTSDTRKSVQDILSRVRSKSKLGLATDNGGATTAANYVHNGISSPDGCKNNGEIASIMTQSMYVSPTHQQHGEMFGNLGNGVDLMTQSVYNPSSTMFDDDADEGDSMKILSSPEDNLSGEDTIGMMRIRPAAAVVGGSPAADYYPTGGPSFVANGFNPGSNLPDVPPTSKDNFGISQVNGISHTANNDNYPNNSSSIIDNNNYNNQMNSLRDDNDNNTTQYDVSLHESQSESQMASVNRNLQSIGLGLLGQVPQSKAAGSLRSSVSNSTTGGFDDLNSSVMSMNVQFDEGSIDNRRNESFAFDMNNVDEQQRQVRIDQDFSTLVTAGNNGIAGHLDDLDSETPHFLVAKSNSPEEAIAAANAALADPNANEVLTAARRYCTDLHNDNSAAVDGGEYTNNVSSSPSPLRSSMNGGLSGDCGNDMSPRGQADLSMLGSESSSSFYTTCQSGGDVENNLLETTIQSGSSDAMSPKINSSISSPVQYGAGREDVMVGRISGLSGSPKENRLSGDSHVNSFNGSNPFN